MPSRGTGKKKSGRSSRQLVGRWCRGSLWLWRRWSSRCCSSSDRGPGTRTRRSRSDCCELAAKRGVARRDQWSSTIRSPRSTTSSFAPGGSSSAIAPHVTASSAISRSRAAARHARSFRPPTSAPKKPSSSMDFGSEAFDLKLTVAEPKVAAVPPTPVPTKRPTATPRPQPAADARGRLAILLDDAGQKEDLVPAAAALPVQVGIAVLPFLPRSAETATARVRGRPRGVVAPAHGAGKLPGQQPRPRGGPGGHDDG